MVISVYTDGFDSLREWIPELDTGGGSGDDGTTFRMYRYKPWFYRRERGARVDRSHTTANTNTTTGTNGSTSNSEPFEFRGQSSTGSLSCSDSPPVGMQDGSYHDNWTRVDSLVDTFTNPSTVSNVGSTISEERSTSQEESCTTGTTDYELSMKRAIEALIDQPGDCVRDGIDLVDIRQSENATLASVAPPGLDNWLLIQSDTAMKTCIEELHQIHPTLIAFDLEACNISKYAQLTCLLQLAVADRDRTTQKQYIIDTLAPGVWDEIHGLQPFFADPLIVKIGHSIAGLDVKCLHRDFGIFVVNAFDTYEASKVLKLPSHGLAAICEYYGLPNGKLYHDLKQQYQSCEWRTRPLTPPMIQYARYDVNYLIPLRELMIRDLTREAWASCPVKEGENVARALALTLKQFEKEEDEYQSSASASSVNDDMNYDDAIDTVEEVQLSPQPQQHEEEDTDSSVFYTPREQRSTVDLTKLDNAQHPYYTTLNDSEDDDARVPTVRLEADELRMQVLLMRVISISQERCLRAWKEQSEPFMQNPHFMSLIHRARRGEVHWSVSRTRLYCNLVNWRNQLALELECLPAFVIPSDFLVCVALRRPLSSEALRRISLSLPVLLRDHDEYMEQLFSTVRDSMNDEPPTESDSGDCYYYYCEHDGEDSSSNERSDIEYSSIVLKACLVIAVLSGVAFFRHWRKMRRS